MADNTKKLVDFIEALNGFEYVSNIDGNYEHMGAIIVDGISLLPPKLLILMV